MSEFRAGDRVELHLVGGWVPAVVVRASFAGSWVYRVRYSIGEMSVSGASLRPLDWWPPNKTGEIA